MASFQFSYVLLIKREVSRHFINTQGRPPAFLEIRGSVWLCVKSRESEWKQYNNNNNNNEQNHKEKYNQIVK